MNPKRTSLDLYQAHRDSLLSYATRLSGDRTAAEDIVQDVWLLFSRQQIETIVTPLNYLRTMVRNLVITRVRRDRKRDVLAPISKPRRSRFPVSMHRQRKPLLRAKS